MPRSLKSRASSNMLWLSAWNPRQRDELKLVAEFVQRLAKLRDALLIELFLPVERGRTVVCKQLAGKLRVHRRCEFAGFIEVRFRRLAPNQVRVRRIRESPRDRRVDATANAIEAFSSALARAERTVARIDVACEQLRGVRIGTRDNDGRNVEHVGRQARRNQTPHRLLRRD